MMRAVTDCLTEGVVDCLSATSLDAIDAHQIVIVIMAPFALMFVWAAWLEFRRWYRHGPSMNRRADFPIDKTAPSYEPPEPKTRSSRDAGKDSPER